MSTKLRFSKKVKEAFKAHRPILALESTIIAHGMPYPNNIEFAIKAESSCLEIGVTPATVAIINGEVCVGLESDELEKIAKGNSGSVSDSLPRNPQANGFMDRCEAETIRR